VPRPARAAHTAASLTVRSGANIKVVQTMMGHASATITWGRYGHLYDDDLDNVAERLDRNVRSFCGQLADNLRTRPVTSSSWDEASASLTCGFTRKRP